MQENFEDYSMNEKELEDGITQVQFCKRYDMEFGLPFTISAGVEYVFRFDPITKKCIFFHGKQGEITYSW